MRMMELRCLTFAIVAIVLCRCHMTRYNDATNQQRIAAAAAAIAITASYHALPESAKAAQRRAWQAQLRAATGCTELTARKHIRAALGIK